MYPLELESTLCILIGCKYFYFFFSLYFFFKEVKLVSRSKVTILVIKPPHFVSKIQQLSVIIIHSLGQMVNKDSLLRLRLHG